MHLNTRTSLLLATLFFPVSILAEEVNFVTGITVEQRGNQAHLVWDAASGDIDFYRIYHSTESILKNEGLYDDFEVTDGPDAFFGFPIPSDTTSLYFAVIAVNKSGEENEVFGEEAHLTISGEIFSSDTSSATASSSAPVSLLGADVTSSTGIIVTFSASLTVEPELAPEGLHIVDADGIPLQIIRISINKKVIAIHTKEQTRGTVYSVEFSEPFIGTSGQPLSDDERSALITGHEDGAEAFPTTQQPLTSDPYNPPDITGLIIAPAIQPDGSYHVTLQWDASLVPQDLMYYLVYQTRDGGKTWGQPGTLPMDIGGVELPGVTPGPFGVYIQTMNAYGYTSKGVFEQVVLPVYVPGYGFYGADLLHKEESAADQADSSPESSEEEKEDVAEEDEDAEEVEVIEFSSLKAQVGVQPAGPIPAADTILSTRDLLAYAGWASFALVFIISVVVWLRMRKVG